MWAILALKVYAEGYQFGLMKKLQEAMQKEWDEFSEEYLKNTSNVFYNFYKILFNVKLWFYPIIYPTLYSNFVTHTKPRRRWSLW